MQVIFGTIAIILAFIYGCLSSFFAFLFPNQAPKNDIRENLDMKIKSSQIEYYEDTHGGFHGDGEEIIIFVPDSKQIEKIKAEWQKTPVDSGIAPLIFPETEYNGLELTKYIPDTEGYWFYKNRADFVGGYACNFSFAFFDGEKVCYYELDT